MYGHDSQHTGRSALAGPAGSRVAAQWAFSAGDAVQSSPSLSGGLLYVGTDDTYLYALNSTTGQQVWAAPTPRGLRSSPALCSGEVVVGGRDGVVYAFDAATGAPRWSFPTPRAFDSSPVVAADCAVYIGGDEGVLYKLVQGVQQWSHAFGDAVYSPALSQDESVVFVASRYYTAAALDAASGKVLWTFPHASGFCSPTAVGFGLVFAAASDYALFALNASTGAQVWMFKTGYLIPTAPALGADGTVFVSSGDGFVYALRSDTGVQLWKLNLDYRGSDSSPTLGADGTLYIGTLRGVTAISTAAGGSVLWQYACDRVATAPIVSQGLVFIGNDGGGIVALVDASSGSPTPSVSPTVSATASATPTPSRTPCAPPSPAAAAAAAAASASAGALAGATAGGAALGAGLACGALALWMRLRRPDLLQELFSEPLLLHSHKGAAASSNDTAARASLYSRLSTLEGRAATDPAAPAFATANQ
jgi:outer membrane protein assembly factor BamB